MADEPGTLVAQSSRLVDAKLDGLAQDIADVKVPPSGVEDGRAVAPLRLEGLEVRIDRFGRRLDLADQPH